MGQRVEGAPLADRQPAHAVVEAGNGDPTLGVLQPGQQLDQRIGRVYDRAPVAARVQVGVRAP